MPGLILKLSPQERFVVNGVVIENGDRRARLGILTPDSNVLRLRDLVPQRVGDCREQISVVQFVCVDRPADGLSAQIKEAHCSRKFAGDLSRLVGHEGNVANV